MSSNIGSLESFLLPIPKIVESTPMIQILSKPDCSLPKFKTPPPRLFKRGFKDAPSSIPKRIKEVLPLFSPLDVYDKIREELLLRNQQRLLRCMHSTIREEERQKTQALLEQRALDSVLKSTGDNQRHQSLSRKMISNRIVHSKRSAIHMDIENTEKHWLYKRQPKFLNIFR